MNDQTERFNAKLDDLLRGEPVDMSGEDGELLQLAGLLAQTDYSTESRVRQTLRAKLTRETRPRKVIPIMTLLQSRRAFATIAAAFIVVMFLTVPPLRTLAQEVITQIGRMIFVHEETRSQIRDGQIAPTTEPGAITLPFGISTVEELSQQTGYPVLAPDYVPSGYTLVMRYVTPNNENREVVSDYMGPEAENTDVLHISQLRFHEDWSAPHWEVGKAVEETVTLRGGEATYVYQAPIGTRRGQDGRFETFGVNILTWQEDEFQFIVQSSALNKDQLLQVAESLK
jgi:anti-sigma factor RsiW